MTIVRCKVFKGKTRCSATIEFDEPLSTNFSGYICKDHPRSVQVQAAHREYDPVKDEADKEIHFQDVAWDPELGGNAKPLFIYKLNIETDDQSDEGDSWGYIPPKV
jgi:hypothetical protein